jgi:diguanylate cyclase (GGDEF)-like protein
MVAALALALGLSLLVLAYSIQALVFPGSSPPGRAWLLALMAGSVLAAAAGAFALRDLAASPGSMSRPEPGAHEPLPAAMPGAESQGAEGQPYGLLDTFSRMLGTIEQQAAEINQYAQRLESAHREIESSNARLKEFSFKDEVTGLYNRRFFSIRLEEEVSRYRRFNHPVSVVLLDLDGFKAVNDELGHAAGDETLRGVADILLKHSRGINVICRYGGDEFAVLLVETSKAGARLYADRIRAVLPARAFSHGRRVTASFGIASLPEDVAPAPDDLIQAADEALYAAKRAGKNRVSVLEDIGVPRGARPGARPE